MLRSHPSQKKQKVQGGGLKPKLKLTPWYFLESFPGSTQ